MSGGAKRIGWSYEILKIVSTRLNIYRLSRDLLKFLVSSTHLLNRMTPELIAIHELGKVSFLSKEPGRGGPEHDIECGM
jgi:hypothetical protein